MADFHTHVTVSSVLGCGYSVAGMVAEMPPSTALVAGGLCGVAGMLPDVDSDSGIPRREAMGFAAAIVPMLLVDRFEQLQFAHDQMVLAAALIYFFVRFAAARLIGKWSVHRGMWHSIPAVLIFAGLAFLIAGPPDDFNIRFFKALAVGLGAMSHLVLDEVYSVDTRGVVPKFKKSFGTAVKLWGKNPSANFSTYAKLALVIVAIAAEPTVLSHIETRNPELADKLRGYSDRLQSYRPSNRFAAQPGAAQPGAAQPPSLGGDSQAPGYGVPGYGQAAYGSAVVSPTPPAGFGYSGTPLQRAPAFPQRPTPPPTLLRPGPQQVSPGAQPFGAAPQPSPWGAPTGYGQQGAAAAPFPSQARSPAPSIQRQ
ncbi:MAG: metal-dependent hydrolase [Planctomycetota bacterium]